MSNSMSPESALSSFSIGTAASGEEDVFVEDGAARGEVASSSHESRITGRCFARSAAAATLRFEACDASEMRPAFSAWKDALRAVWWCRPDSVSHEVCISLPFSICFAARATSEVTSTNLLPSTAFGVK